MLRCLLFRPEKKKYIKNYWLCLGGGGGGGSLRNYVLLVPVVESNDGFSDRRPWIIPK